MASTSQAIGGVPRSTVTSGRYIMAGKPFNGLETFGLDKSRLRLTNLPSPMRGRKVGDQGSAPDQGARPAAGRH
ncbi:MAG: hypothetical protein V5B34_05265 [Accumulibacter sp.]